MGEAGWFPGGNGFFQVGLDLIDDDRQRVSAANFLVAGGGDPGAEGRRLGQFEDALAELFGLKART